MKQLRAWIYVRIDSTADVEDIVKSLEKELCVYAEKMGFVIVDSSQDFGSSLAMNRPGLHKTMKAAEGGKMGVLLVKRIDSIGRDTMKMLDFLQEMERLGFSLYTPREGGISLTQPRTFFLR